MKSYFSNSPIISDKDAKIIGKFIDSKFNGKVTARELLEAARPRTSPIHKYFEWDDGAAAELYRLKQASQLIISVYVEADNKTPMRSYLRVKLDKPTYLHHDQVAKNDELIEQVILAAKEQLERWKNRYEQYCDYFRFEFHTKGEQHVIEKEVRGKESKYSGGKRQKSNVNNRRLESTIS